MDAEERKALFRAARAESYEVALARHSVPEPEPRQTSTRRSALTDSEIVRLIDSKIAGALAERDHISLQVQGQVIAHERKRCRDEIGKLRADLQGEIEKLQRSLSGDRGAEVIDLPPSAWSPRRA